MIRSLLFLPLFCYATIFPDLGGIPDFDQPKTVENQVFILTNPKSGSHLLLYSLMKVAQHPLRGRLPYYLFCTDPNCAAPENLMNYPIDFTKSTFYWGHEYSLLRHLNCNNNKLIFILRNYKETVMSNLVYNYHYTLPKDSEDLALAFTRDVCSPMTILQSQGKAFPFHDKAFPFHEYMTRLQLFDDWNPQNRLLIHYEDLIAHPEIFLPQILTFLNENIPYEDFIANYPQFLAELGHTYLGKGNTTGAGTNLHYFHQFIPVQLLHNIDTYVQQQYPTLWTRYLEPFKE